MVKHVMQHNLLLIRQMDIEESNKNKYLMLVSTDKIKDLINSITNISNYYDKKYIILRENIMFPFHGNIMFSEIFFKRKCKKAAFFPQMRILG